MGKTVTFHNTPGFYLEYTKNWLAHQRKEKANPAEVAIVEDLCQLVEIAVSVLQPQPTGGIKVNYQITQVIEGEASVIDRDETCDRDVHPDLLGLFEDLRSIVARVFNVTAFLSFLESPEMKLPDSKKALARDFADGLLDKIDVRGVSWSGSDENVGVVVTAVMETPNGLKSFVNTPRIKLAQISFGFEEELERICGQIKSEIYDYLFKGKQAQLSLFGGTVEPENELDGQE